MVVRIPRSLKKVTQNVFVNDNNILSDKFEKDYNILTLHVKVISILESKKYDKKIDKTIEKYKGEIEATSVTAKKEIINRKLNAVLRFKQELEDETIIQKYIKESKPYLEEYKKVKNVNEHDRIQTILSYLDVLKNYIEHNIYYKPVIDYELCNICGESIKNLPTNDLNQVECSNCGNLKNIIPYPMEITQMQSLVSMSSNEEVNIDTFKRDMMRYRCLSLDFPDPSICKSLDNYFSNNNSPLGEEIKLRKYDEIGRKIGTSPKVLKQALVAIKKEKLIPYINYIGMIYWGWKKPPISDEIEELIYRKRKEMHRCFIDINIDSNKKIISPPSQFLLWKHLEMEGIECYPEEFKLPSSKDSMERYMKQWKIMCEKTESPDIFFIP